MANLLHHDESGEVMEENLLKSFVSFLTCDLKRCFIHTVNIGKHSVDEKQHGEILMNFLVEGKDIDTRNEQQIFHFGLPNY